MDSSNLGGFKEVLIGKHRDVISRKEANNYEKEMESEYSHRQI
jgi:hypothetical protein